MLPEMPCLQFLVVEMLFAGPQTGVMLRRKLKKAGAKVASPSFSRLMQRMEEAGYVQAELDPTSATCRLMRPRRFEVTDLGVAVWKQVRDFYAMRPDPPSELVPIVTEEGALAHLPKKQRHAAIRRRTHRQIDRLIERHLGKDVMARIRKR